MTTIYNQDELRADYSDDEVRLYIIGERRITMTVQEFVNIALALTDNGIVAVLPTVDKEYDL